MPLSNKKLPQGDQSDASQIIHRSARWFNGIEKAKQMRKGTIVEGGVGWKRERKLKR